MRHFALLATGLAVSTTLLAACSDSDLYAPRLILEPVHDNRLTISGGFCAEGADDLESFLKIMFIIDKSNSMNVTDPNNRRISAAQEVVQRFAEDLTTMKLRAGIEFAVISFFGDTTVHTKDERGLPGFSTDGTAVMFALSQLALTGSNTGYDKALAQAFLLIDRDMAQLSDKARPRTRYEVIFASDGMPFPDNCRGENNAPSAAVRAVQRIKALQTIYGVQLRFNTAFCSMPGMFTGGSDVDQCLDSDAFEANYNGSIGEETRAFLQSMSTAGGGTFKQFENGDAINFLDFEFAESRRIFALSNFVASNINARPNRDDMEPDTDGDGLTDAHEALLGTEYFLADSDFDGFSDLLEHRYRLSGFDPLDPTDADCDELGFLDTDGDGLRDCEESFLGTLRRHFDTDFDGLPDYVEILFDADANSANALQDRQADADADGGSNADEIRWHTDPRLDDVAERSKIAYDYYQRELAVTDGRACYSFEVKNVRMASTRATPAELDPAGIGRGAGWNRVMLYFAQTPYDDPLGEPLYRVACVEGRFMADQDVKVPADGVFEIPSRRPSDTYRAAPVLRPHDDVCIASVNQDCGLDTVWCRHETDGTCMCRWPPNDGADSPDGDDDRPAFACPACADGLDNDGDGTSDYPYELDCFDSMDNDEGSNFACKDGLDNDGDGRIDWPNEPGCDSAYDTDEANPAMLPVCGNGGDDDGDGLTDFPNDPGCDSAADFAEGISILAPTVACDDGFDNDGDGLIDLADPGCGNIGDVDEDGPQACFFCELFSADNPGQCDISAGLCKPRAGSVPIPAGGTRACVDRADCRGGVCNAGNCAPCLESSDCDSAPGAGDGLCNVEKGWCLAEVYTPTICTADADCPSGPCATDIGYCTVDPLVGCRSEKDCYLGDRCSEERGFCLTSVFETRQCNRDTPCSTGRCDKDTGWCLPEQGSEQCVHSDECPFGECLPSGACDQQTFVQPEAFRAEVDCLLGR